MMLSGTGRGCVVAGGDESLGCPRKNKDPLDLLFARVRRGPLRCPQTPMLIVVNDPTHVERELRARRLSCPHCGGELQPWGHARRRVFRAATHNEEHHPRRARCSNCLVTSVLLLDTCDSVPTPQKCGALIAPHALCAWMFEPERNVLTTLVRRNQFERIAQ